MRALRRFLKRLTGTASSERRLQAEIEEHLAFQIEENLRAGLPPAEARRQALLKFGPVESIRESWRDERVLPSLETLAQDTRHALRRLRKSPAFTLAVVLTLALGIGATTSIFTLVDAVLLRSLPVANPGDLYRLGKNARCCFWPAYSQDEEFSLVSYDLYKYFRNNTTGFSELAAFEASRQFLGVRFSGDSAPVESYPGEFVSGNYFAMFGVRASAGRMLTDADDRPGAAPVAVMSCRLWQQRYGSDPSIVGRAVNIDRKPFTLVGITAPGFFGDTLSSNPPDFFLPLIDERSTDGEDYLDQTDSAWLDVIGRIRPGSNQAAIEAQMRLELKVWLRSHWSEMSAGDRAKYPRQTLYLWPGGAGISSMREEYEHWLRILMMVTGFVLLIVCANVANLILVRAVERRRQISVSMALGAKSSRVVSQALTESILLSLFGGLIGLAVAFAGTRLILHFAFPVRAGMPGVPISAAPSIPVLLFAFAVSLVTGIVFGIAPAWMAARVDPVEALRGAGRSTVHTGSLPRNALVVFQAALSLVLLSGSGLLTAALHKVENQDFGFDANRRLVARMDPAVAGYRLSQLPPLYRRIRDSLSRIPAVSAVALCFYSPMSSADWGEGVWVDGRPAPGPNEDNYANWDRVTPRYTEVIGNRMLRGRDISEQDSQTSRHVAVINEAFARKFFGNEDPIGRHFGQHGIGSEHEYEIVGIAKNSRYSSSSLTRPVGAFYLLPAAQYDLDRKTGQPDNDGSNFMRDMVIVTRPGATLSEAQLRRAIAAVDPNLPIPSMRTLKEQIAGEFTQARLIARLASLFGFLSLVLASIGLYGVTAHSASRRTSEIGVRMALGANRASVIALVLRGAFSLIALGLLIGLPISAVSGQALGSLLYGANPTNPAVILAAVAALGFAALIAALIPALRAGAMSPLDALRTE